MLSIGLISLLLAIPLFSYRITPILFNRITSILLIYSALLSFNVLDITSLASGLGIYSGLFHVSATTLSIEAFLFICAAIILMGFTNNNKFTEFSALTEYPLMVVFTVIGQSLLISSSDIVSMYLSIELQSFAVYVLCTLYRNSESATSAGLKYFLLGGLSSAVILLGTSVIYSYTGLTEFESIYCLLTVSNSDNTVLTQVIFGMVLIGIGFLFKVAAAPLHNWAPDVYDGVPTIVTVFISTMPKISFFMFLVFLETNLNYYNNIINIDINIWKNLLLTFSLFSLILGTVLGLSQYRIKRLLAYSTISHVGFILLCLTINSEESIESFLFYIISYSLTNICAFLCILAFGYMRNNDNNIITNKANIGDIQFISEMKGQFNRNPVLAFSLSMCLFSIAGIPPLIGFFAKQMVLYSSIHIGYYFMSAVCIIVSVISASYYLKIVKVLYNYENINTNLNTIKSYEISNMHSLCIALLSVIICLFILEPQILLNSSNLLALTLFYY